MMRFKWYRRFARFLRRKRMHERQRMLERLHKKYPSYILTERAVFGNELEEIDNEYNKHQEQKSQCCRN